MPLSSGDNLGPYEILSPIGAGGMGEVYKARDTRLDRLVAIKTSKSAFSQRFAREARAVAALNHPNICQLYDLGTLPEGGSYLVMEFIDGSPIAAVDSPRKLLDLAVQIADGMSAAHAAGFTHRDLKPDNILVTGPKTPHPGRVKILDFGLAKYSVAMPPSDATMTIAAVTDPGTVIGTVAYMSPEQARGENVDARSDQFSFGLIVYELAAGKRAFVRPSAAETMAAIIRDEAEPLPATVPAPLRWVAERCLAKDPAERYDSTKDLYRELKLARERLSEPNLLAFQALVDGQTQVAVMKPESGNWSLLTRDRDQGPLQSVSWSSDGSLIYYDRYTDGPRGIYSIPVLGGDSRVILENAMLPEPLPDGSLLIAKFNAEHIFQLHRFWPATGRLHALPIQLNQTVYLNPPARGSADGKTALVLGEPLGQNPPGPGFHIIELSSGSMRRLNSPGLAGAVGYTSLARDDKSLIALVHSGALTKIVRFPTSGSGAGRELITTTSAIWYPETGLGESVYASVVDRPADLVRFAPDGTKFERLASFPQLPDPISLTVLPDGRAVLPVRASSQLRLMVVQKGKDPAPLVNTAEETAGPVATCGPREIAFMIGPEPHETIAIAEPASGRLVRTLASGKGPVVSLACAPDGKTIFFAARGVVWSVPSAGSATPEARRIRVGDGVVADPSGAKILVRGMEGSEIHLFSVPLDGSAERKIPLGKTDPVAPVPLAPNALSPDGRLLVGLVRPDLYFNPPGLVDTNTGRVTRMPSEILCDYQGIGWTPDEHVIALKIGTRATMWKFQPAPR